MPRKIFLRSFTLLLPLLLSACATNPPDAPVCVEITMDEGQCINIVSGKKFKIDEKEKFKDMEGVPRTWWELRPAMIQVPASSWAQIRAFIIKICKKNNQCQKEVSTWERSIQTIDAHLGEKLPGL